MAMDAEPHPFFNWATKGTSIQRAGVSAAGASTAPAAKRNTSPRMRRRFMSTNGHDDQDDREGHQHDDQEVAIGERSRCELILGFLRARGEISQIIVVELLHSAFHLLGVNVR